MPVPPVPQPFRADARDADPVPSPPAVRPPTVTASVVSRALAPAGAVRAGLAALGSPRAEHSLAELRARSAPVPADVPDPAGAVGVLLVLRDVATEAAVAGGMYTVRDDSTVEVVGLWTTDSTRVGLRRRVLWELEAEARRRGFVQVVAGAATADPAAAGILHGAGFVEALHDAAGEPVRGKVLPGR